MKEDKYERTTFITNNNGRVKIKTKAIYNDNYFIVERARTINIKHVREKSITTLELTMNHEVLIDYKKIVVKLDDLLHYTLLKLFRTIGRQGYMF